MQHISRNAGNLETWKPGNLETWKPGIPENKAWNPKTRNDFFSDDKRSKVEWEMFEALHYEKIYGSMQSN